MAAVVGLPDRRLLLPADALHRGLARRDHRAGGDLRPGARRDDLPHARRGGGAGQQHAATAWPPASGARTSIWRSMWRRRFRPARSGSTAPTSSTRPPASAATARAATVARVATKACTSTSSRRGRSPSPARRCGTQQADAKVNGNGRKSKRAALATETAPASNGNGAHVAATNGRRAHGNGATTAKTTAADFLSWPRIDRTPKLFIGGKQARPDSGYSRTIYGPQRRGGRRGRRGQPQGHPQRRRGGAHGCGWLGRRHGAQSRADPLLHRRESGRRARRVRRAARAA